MTDATAPIGELIAAHRRRRGMSQAVLAGLLGRSESWLSQVERGVRQLDRLSVIAEIAAVLRIPASALVPGSLLPAGEEADHPAAWRLRLALSGHDILVAMFADLTAGDGEPVALADAANRVEDCWALVHDSRYVDLGEQLPDLIRSMELRARRPSGDEAVAFRLLAEVYQVTAAALAKLAQTDVAWIAADRAVAAAERAHDPLMAAAGDFRLAHVFLQGGRLAQAERVVDVALAALATRAESDEAPEVASLWGALNLVAAIVASRQGDAEAAYARLRAADQAATRVGTDRNDFHTEFGPTNVAVHTVAVAVELGDAGLAVRTARTVDTAWLSAERRARFLIDVARAHAQRRNAHAAVEALVHAEGLTPEQVRTHVAVHEIVRDLMRGERRRPNPELRALARRVGLLR